VVVSQSSLCKHPVQDAVVPVPHLSMAYERMFAGLVPRIQTGRAAKEDGAAEQVEGVQKSSLARGIGESCRHKMDPMIEVSRHELLLVLILSSVSRLGS